MDNDTTAAPKPSSGPTNNTTTIRIEEPSFPPKDTNDPDRASREHATGVSTGVNFRSRGSSMSSCHRPELVGGVFNPRSIISRGKRPADSRSSHDNDTTSQSHLDIEEGDDWRGGYEKKKQVFKGRTLLWLAYQSVGVIYGDIGTSPLYVFSSTFTAPPTHRDLLQVLSVVIWSITILVTFKYIFVILHADNEGEGGTFSCYSLLTRFANITERDPREQVTVRMERHLTNDLKPPTRSLRAKLEGSRFTHVLLKIIGVLAVSMVMSDGVLTPAQSVLGAVQGLSVVKPDISKSTVTGTTCGILVLLFLIQPLGTSKIATTFAPIVIVWLGLNFSFGIYNLVTFDWTVLKAFSPYFAFQFFIEHKKRAWRMLGGVLLSFTGVEALFADLGAFSLHAIQLSWMCYTYPCLLLAYIGQAAYISHHPDAYTNPFFNAAPPGTLYPSLVIAILAAIVASQAMITATFQLISQIMKLSYCPQVKVVHTSQTFHGQIYVPFVNWLLMLGAILVTAVYGDTVKLGNAYGVCVMFVTFFDTCMVTLVSLIVWKLSPFLVFVPWLVFASVDGLYLSAALIKVPEGAWFTLTLSGILTSLFLLWRFGKENQWRAEAEDRFKPSHLIVKDKNEGGRLRLQPVWGGDPLSSLRGFGIFFDKTGVMTPAVFTHYVTKFVAIPEVAVFFHLHPVEAPTVLPEERYAVSHVTAVPGCYRLVIKHGFMDQVISPDLAALIYEQIRRFVVRQATERMRALEKLRTGEDTDCEGEQEAAKGETSHRTESSGASGPDGVLLPVELRDEEAAAELARLDRAYASKILYVVGKEQMRIKTGAPIARRFMLSVFLWIRDNTRAKIANLQLAMDRLVEVGFVKEI
ncbi:hypothetical protein NEUTE1DRAFT_149642 [Neurospora tetrasperma FGSC 2508]|uniref:Potassium transporter n=1 Tax=Neurospora tetrasperma (strain FGSC 2508 / ATCC MYA-4615 / P0657) TaxID=510951 RepID=F8MZC3_NEUT8|nr:uncharacterized protein NEUTE1DRAFT_149642 [Neurospora tetrasperma FGSC 2508]EGO52014.1 hypothetical protein NEUTE1DRAFT_149642 [Neurospora tetrasperma FGSC 2508]